MQSNLEVSHQLEAQHASEDVSPAEIQPTQLTPPDDLLLMTCRRIHFTHSPLGHHQSTNIQDTATSTSLESYTEH